MRCRVLFLVSLLTCSLFGAGHKYRPVFRDFSLKGEAYRPLEDLRLVADDVIYQGSEETTIFGKSHIAAKFAVLAPVRVQTMCAIGSIDQQSYATGPARLELLVIDDADHSIYDAWTRAIYETWRRNETCSDEYCFNTTSLRDARALAIFPASVDEKDRYDLWVHGRAVRISLREIAVGGMGAMFFFMRDNLRVRLAGENVMLNTVPLHIDKTFLRRYEQGTPHP